MKRVEEIRNIFSRLQEQSAGDGLCWGATAIAEMTNGALSVDVIQGLMDKGVIVPTYEVSETNHNFAHFGPTQIRKAIVAEKLMMREPIESRKWDKFKTKLNIEMIKKNGLGEQFFEQEWGQAVVLAMAGVAGIEV